MVNPNVALACASAGAVLVAVAFFLGIAFMTSEAFATAGLGCNPEILTNADAQTAAEAFCVDNVVSDAAGTACQIANLGLYTASYTPECTQGEDSPYALSSLLAPESGAPSDITVLFPSQTGLGSLPTGLQFAGADDIAFTDCDSFFAGTTGAAGTGLASQLTTNAAVGNLDVILGSFLEATKASFDAAVSDLVASVNSTLLLTAPITFTATMIGIASVETLSVIGTDVTVPIGPDLGANYTTNLRASAASAGFGGKIADVVAACIEAGLVASPSTTNALTLAAIGFDLLDNGIPDLGLWGTLSSDILCNIIVQSSPCTGVQYIDALAAEMFGFGASGGDLATLVFTASAAKDLYRSNIEAQIPSLTSDAIVSGSIPGNPTVTFLFSTDQVIGNTQGAFNASTAELGNPTGFPNTPFLAMENENSAMSLLCGGVGLLSSCTTTEFLAATVQSFYDSGDNDTAASAEVVQLMVGTCALGGQTLTDCFAISNGFNPATTSELFRSIVMFEVFGSLYGLEESAILEGEAAIVADMIAACKDSEKDLAAIALVQILTPVGAAFIGLGAIISVANLLMRNDKVKVIGVVGGVLSLIGVILVLVGLLTLQGAPIYASIGADPPAVLPDNSTTFSLGGGYTLVLAFLGGGIVGSLVAIIGGALLSPKESSTDILGKA